MKRATGIKDVFWVDTRPEESYFFRVGKGIPMSERVTGCLVPSTTRVFEERQLELLLFRQAEELGDALDQPPLRAQRDAVALDLEKSMAHACIADLRNDLLFVPWGSGIYVCV